MSVTARIVADPNPSVQTPRGTCQDGKDSADCRHHETDSPPSLSRGENDGKRFIWRWRERSRARFTGRDGLSRRKTAAAREGLGTGGTQGGCLAPGFEVPTGLRGRGCTDHEVIPRNNDSYRLIFTPPVIDARRLCGIEVMEPDRRKRISELHHAALARLPAERPGFLQAACDGDEFCGKKSVTARVKSASSGLRLRPLRLSQARHREADTETRIGPHASRCWAGGRGGVYRARQQAPVAAWRKEICHFASGGDPSTGACA